MTRPDTGGFLNLSEICKSFSGHSAVQDINLTISQGESVCFLGPSGCGKTTLLRLIAGLEAPDTGRILLNGQDITRTSPIARNFGMVFQSYSLFPHLTVGKNVAYGLNCRKWDKTRIRIRVQEMLDLVHLADQIDKHPHQLSGGQQQRVAIARALAAQPHVLLLDEPFSALDARVRGQLRTDMRTLQTQLGITTILVTHDQEEAMEVADRIVVMKEGRIEQIGNGHQIYHQPQSSFVAGFVGDMNTLRVQHMPGAGLMLAGQPLTINGEFSKDCRLVGIRPEAVRLETGTKNSFTGTVMNSRFTGKQTRLEITLGDQSITLELHGRQNRTFAAGHQVNVYLPPDEIRQLNER